MKRRRLHRALTAVIVWIGLSGCCSVFSAENAGVTLDNGCFKVNFTDPNDTMLGYRFIRAGWIRSLRTCDSPGQCVFLETSLFSYHPAFGFAREILPEFDLSEGCQLKIGVGIIRPHPRSRYHPVPVRIFPWKTEFSIDGKKNMITAEQSSGDCEGYGYLLRVKVTVETDSPVIVYEETLINTGSRLLAGTVYAHPFFAALENGQDCRYWMPGFRSSRPVAEFSSRTVHSTETPPGSRSVAVDTPAGHIVIGSNRPFAKTDFWNPGRDCFAVEPHIAYRLAAGGQFSWKWYLGVFGHGAMPGCIGGRSCGPRVFLHSFDNVAATFPEMRLL